MIVDFSLKQKADLLQKVVGKSFVWDDMWSYDHGKSDKTTVAMVEIINDNKYIKLVHDMHFEDGTTHSYTTDGSWFFDYYRNDIQKHLGVEVYWEVKKDGVTPIMLSPQELRKSDSWLIAHEYNGMIIFENYSRAKICWYEKYGM